MSSSSNEHDIIREYLLGQLSAAAREEFERRFFTDDDLFKDLQAAEDDLIDDFLTGDLSEEEVVMFHQNFLVGAERQQKLRIVQAWRKYAAAHAGEKPPPKLVPHSPSLWPRFFSHPLRIAALAAVVLIATFGVWNIFTSESPVDEGLLALNDAYKQERPLESRITNLNYAPYETLRGPGNSKVNDDELRRAELILLDAIKNKPTPAAYHALGKVYLAKREFENAIKQFEAALKDDSSNAQIYADVGAAYLEKGKNNKNGPVQGQSVEDLGRALENLNRALQLDGRLLEAVFNRALTFEEQMLWKQAETAWNDYLAHDSLSPWAKEAQDRLSKVQQRSQQISRDKNELVNDFKKAFENRDDDLAWALITKSYTSRGCPIANDLLTSFLNKDPDEKTSFAALAYLAELERERAGDLFHSDLVRYYEGLPDERRQTLASVRRQVDKAFDYLTTSRSTEAISLLAKSKQEFERQGNAGEASLTDYRIAQSYAVQPNMEESGKIFTRLHAHAENQKYRWLTGQSLIGLAHVSLGVNQYSRAVAYSKRGLALFESSGNADGIVRALRQLAEEYVSLNRIPESLEFLEQSLAIASDHFADPLVRWGLYITVSFNLDSLGLLTAAAAYQMEALMIALDVQRPLITSRSYAYLGTTYGKLKDFPRAIKNLEEAYETGRALEDDPNGREIMANSSLQLGDLYRLTGESTKALKAYEQCLQLYGNLGMQYFSYAAHRGKLLTYLDLQDDSGVEHELETIMSSLEEYRSSIKDETQRNSFFETQQEIYDEAIDFAYVRKHDPQAAFHYSELSRARSLLDSFLQPGEIMEGKAPDLRSRGVASPQSLSALRNLMPDQSQLLQFAVLDDKIVIWLITPKDFAAREVKIGKTELTQLVRQYLDSIAKNRTGDRGPHFEGAKQLYNILLAPVESLLDKNRQLCIIPDKILSYLPFGALVSPNSNRYLIQDFALQLAPSANVFINATVLAAKKSHTGQERLFAVGNPDFDRTAFPHLQNLDSAKHEAEVVASYYNSPALLQENAREQQIKEGMRKADVVHLAMHYMVDERSEMLSKLVLAKESKGHAQDGELHAYEVYQMALPQTRLAVLSACQTGIDRNFAGEGAVSIARPFLAAGVTLVVASLWPVDSNSTSDLMIRFHRNRKHGKHSTVEALRLAQLELLTSEDSRHRQPYHWAPFVVMGGYASF